LALRRLDGGLVELVSMEGPETERGVGNSTGSGAGGVEDGAGLKYKRDERTFVGMRVRPTI
jgi:hypothetical protein